MNQVQRLFIVALSTLAFALLPAHAVVYRGDVARVVDGDGLYLVGVERQIRLFGIDAPEKNEDGFSESTRALELLVTGQRLVCEEIDQDRYYRIIGRCERESDHLDIGRQMVEDGFAVEYCRYSKNFYGRCPR